LSVIDLSIESKKVSAFANRTDYIRNSRSPAGNYGLYPMKCVVVRWTEQISHPGVSDDELLSTAALTIQYSRQQHTGVANQKTTRLQNDLESGAADDRGDDFAEMFEIGRASCRERV